MATDCGAVLRGVLDRLKVELDRRNSKGKRLDPRVSELTKIAATVVPSDAPVVQPPVVIPGPPPVEKPPEQPPASAAILITDTGPDAFARALETAAKRGGEQAIRYSGAGPFQFRPMRIPAGLKLTISGPAEALLVRPANTTEPLLAIGPTVAVRGLTFDGNAANQRGDTFSEIEMEGGTVDGVVIRNWRDHAIDYGGSGGKILRAVLVGTNPGSGGQSYFGVWSGKGSGSLDVEDCVMSGTGANLLFLEGSQQHVRRCKLFDGHLSPTRMDNGQMVGGGLICLSSNSRDCDVMDNEIGPSPSLVASGIEIEGNHHSVERNKVRGLLGIAGIVVQQGQQHVVRTNDLQDNNQGIYQAGGTNVYFGDGELVNTFRNNGVNFRKG